MASQEAWLLVLAGAFVAEVIGTMAGFGAATLLTPIAACFMDIKTAIAVVACFHLFGNASRLVFFGRHIHWPTWAQFGITGVFASLAGAAVTAQLPSPMVKLAFGFFLLLYVALSSESASRWQLPSHPATLVGGGVLSGFVAGLIGTGGAIRSACLLVFGLPKEAYIGTSAAIALMVDATRLPVYVAERFIPVRMVPVLVSLVAVAFAGAWIGQRLIRQISSAAFRRFVLIMLALMGLKLLVEAWGDRASHRNFASRNFSVRACPGRNGQRFFERSSYQYNTPAMAGVLYTRTASGSVEGMESWRREG